MENELGPSAWATEASEVKYENAWLTVREDQAVRPDGTACKYGVMSTKGYGVLIVAFDTLNRVALVQADRYPLLQVQFEVPGGGTEGETPEVSARRELLEECSLIAGTIEHIGSMTVLGGLVHHRNVVMVAQQCEEVEDASVHREDDVVGFEFYTVAQALEMVRTGLIVDAETTAALMQAFLHMDLLTY